MSTSGVAVRAGDRASRSGVSAVMSGEDERASRPRGAPSPPDVPSTSSSGPRDTARPEDAEARSPRSRERLARAKAEVAALAARVRGHDPSAISGGVSFAPSDPRVIAAPLDASGARVYDRDRLGSHGTLSRRGDSWWFFDTHPEFVRETLASDAAVMRCPHLIGNRPTRAPHAIVTERRADDGTGAARFLRDPNDTTSRARLDAARPSLRRTAHCCECWERLEVKRARAAVACHACGEAFPMGKTEPFPLLCDPKIAMTLTRDASAAATARAAKVVDVCFLCAPDWKETRALEDTRRDQIAGLEARHATYDAASRAFAELPLAARTALVESRVEQKKQTASAFPKTATAASAATSVEPVPTPVEPSREERADVSDSAANPADIELAAVAASAAEAAESLTTDLLRKTRAAEARKRGAGAFADSTDGFDEDPDEDPDALAAADADADGTKNATARDFADSTDDHASRGAREAAAIVAALRRRGDDVDAAMRDTRDARGEETAAMFALRTIGDADEAAARAAERDRARLDEVMRRDGGAYPLRRSVRYSTTDDARVDGGRVSFEQSGAAGGPETNGPGPRRVLAEVQVLPDFYDTEEKREAALREKAQNRDAVSVAVAAEEETTRLAEEASRREARASETARRAKRERETRKLEKWAAVGVDVAEYAPPGFELRDAFFGRIDSVERGVRAYAASPRMTPKADDTKDAAVEEADGVSVGKNEPPKGAEARDEKTKPPKPPASEDASGFRPSAHVTTTRKMETGLVVGPTASHHSRAVRSTGAEKNAPAFVVEILETVLARASETAEARAAASVTAVASVASVAPVAPVTAVASVAPVAPVASVASTDATASSRKRNTEAPREDATRDAAEKLCGRRRRRAAPSVDVLAAADSGRALPAHPRAPPGAAGLAAAWTGAAARRRRRLRNVVEVARREDDGGNDANASALVHNAPHGRAHEPFDEDDAPGVPIPLREALRVAAELPSALASLGIGDGPDGPEARRFADDPSAFSAETETVQTAARDDRGANATDTLSSDETAAAFARARARREEKTRLAHAKLRGVALGIGDGSEKLFGDERRKEEKENVTDAMRAAALSLGRVIVPFARLTDTTRIDDANRSASHGESSAVPASADAERRAPNGSPGAGGASVGRDRRLSASTASALVAEAASRAKRAVAGALGETLAERKARVFDLGLPASPDQNSGAPSFLTEAEREADFLRAARKREKAIRAREAIRRRGEALLEAEDALSDADAFGENRGVCAVDVATRAPALGFRTDPSRERATAGVDEPSLSFSEKERAYYAETFGRGSEPPREPSALALAAFANVPNALERTARPEATSNAIPGDAEARGPRRADASSVSATDLKRRSNDDVKRNDDGNDAERVSASREPLRRVTSSATDVSEPSETREVFVDLEDTPDRLADRPADASAAEKLLVAASEKLRALADAHRLKLDAARPFPERHLRTEASSPETEYAYDTAAGIAIQRDDSLDAARTELLATIAAETIDSDDSDAAYQRLATPFDSDGVPTPTLADLDTPTRPATPETDLPTESDEETDWTNVAYTNRFVDASGRSLRLYADDADGDDDDDAGARGRSARGSVDDADGRTKGGTVREPSARDDSDVTVSSSRETRVEADVETTASSPPSSPRRPDPPAEDDYESRIARIAAVADRVSERARHETRAALGGGARTRASTSRFESDESVGFVREQDASETRLDERDASNAPVNAVSVSFFFPGVPYEDVATPHARGRVERFVGREIKRAVVAAVAEASIRIAEADVEVVGMSRGPPPAVAAATEADAASREVVKGTRFGNEDTTDDRLDHGFALLDERTTGYASDDAGRRARALAVHCAIRLPNETLSGSSASTSLRRLKNSRAARAPVSNRRLMFREPRDDEDARRERRAAAKARWDRLRRTGVAVTNMSSRPIRGVGRAEVAVTGSGALSALPPPPPPPPLVDLFGGDEAAAEAFREEKFMRDVKDAEDDIEFPDDDDDGARPSSSSSSRANEERNVARSRWSYDPLDAMFAKPPLAIDQTQPHERLLSRSPLERLAVLADAHAATRLERKSVVTIVQSDDRTVFDEIRDANADPLALRERQRAEANARNADLGWKRLKANRARHDGTRDDVHIGAARFKTETSVSEEENVAPGRRKTQREKEKASIRLSPARFASVRADGDAYVNPRLVRLEAGKPRETARVETFH